MSRQAAHALRERERGCVFRSIKLEPATVAALAQLRARGAKSDAQAVNAAIVAHEQRTRLPAGRAVVVPIVGYGTWVFDLHTRHWSEEATREQAG